MVKIFIDAGHGGTDPGATGNGLREKDITLTLALKTRNILNEEYDGHTIKLSRTTDQTLSLRERTNMANKWGASYLLSIHINAGGGTGFESFTYNGNYRGKHDTNRLRLIIHDEIVHETRFKNRGKKEANFHMVRESNMPACLTESGFIDHSSDATQLKSDVFLTKVARGHAVGIAKALGLRKKSTTKNNRVVVVTGSFKKRSNASIQVDRLKNAGFDSFIDIYKINGVTYYRVISGSFIEQTNAEARVQSLKNAGFSSFIYTT